MIKKEDLAIARKSRDYADSKVNCPNLDPQYWAAAFYEKYTELYSELFNDQGE